MCIRDRLKKEYECLKEVDKFALTNAIYNMDAAYPVSYTHLDVYKRQTYVRAECNGAYVIFAFYVVNTTAPDPVKVEYADPAVDVYKRQT